MAEKKTEKKISRREALKRMAKAGTAVAGVVVFTTALSGCYIDYQDSYSDYSNSYSDYSNSYSDYSDYSNSYSDYSDYGDSYGDYGN